MKKKLILPCSVTIAILAAAAVWLTVNTRPVFVINKCAEPEIYDFVKIPPIKQSKIEMWDFDIRGGDISGIDLSKYPLRIMELAIFDSFTKFPTTDKLPARLDPNAIMENGKNPGLKVRELHKLGLDGSGIKVAIIDQPLNTKHKEYNDKIIHYEQIGYDPRIPAQMHGPAVTSILAGDTVGVAPGVKIVYFAAQSIKPNEQNPQDFDSYFDDYVMALEKIVEMNKKLPDKDRIKVVSVSWGELVTKDESIKNLIKRMQNKDIFVITTATDLTHGVSFHGLNRGATMDPDNVNSYDRGLFWVEDGMREFFDNKTLLVPMDHRTTASQGDDDAYVHYPSGGLSWSVPYIAGLYAIAKQTDAKITPQKFWDTALETGVPLERNGYVWGKIVQPLALVKHIKSKKNAEEK